MKSTGITRKLDELGRIVIPKELRKTLNFNERDALEIFTDNDKVILRKYEASKACAVTGTVSDDNIEVAGKYYSPEGLAQIYDVARKVLHK